MGKRSLDDGLQEKIATANVFYGYSGTGESRIDHKRRLRFIEPFRDAFLERMKYFGINKKSLFCKVDREKGKTSFSFWDYLPKGECESNYSRIEIDSAGRITLPLEAGNKKRTFYWYGKGDHVEIDERKRKH
jgi:hypothetical protein